MPHSASKPAAAFDPSRCLIRIVDDEANVRSGLSFLLSSENWPSNGYASAEDFLERDNGNIPGCLILDVRLGRMNGLALQLEMERRGMPLPIIFISAHGEMDMAVRTMQHGAIDFIAKPVDPDRLLAAVEKAARRDFERHQIRIEAKLLARRWASLTPRERDVAQLLRQGALNKQMAAELGIAERTVQSHRAVVLQKLGVRSPVELDRLMRTLEAAQSDTDSSVRSGTFTARAAERPARRP